MDKERILRGDPFMAPKNPNLAGGEQSAAPRKEKPKSRSTRWEEAAARAVAAIEELIDIQSEFSDWRDNLPDNLQQSPVGEKLDAVCDIDLESALSSAQEAEGADLPLGFGRD